ncbi:LPXTG cell wall anchor domain-containing protein [Clostridium omnivorum]|uniref:LPXTG cell wall anchor domain-containing protein n=1 Tax=Clostridium omnivorum TaxID=1604902 RepID=A0ABQ5N6U8_9CLOT|nr:LPXTG cell wall anchor domain-containing protein [Clostridium sp. E14]GLC30978.1 hypothetical protein bsdE14_23880 [Clostridium sp. E14]
MKTQKKKSFAILLVLLFCTMLLKPFDLKVKAEEPSVPKFMDRLPESTGFFAQYKNKTIINNTVWDSYNLNYSVYENGVKHVITNDFDKLRWMRFIGTYNDSAYSICTELPGKPIYRADLNTYKFEFVKNVPEYTKGSFYYKDCSVDNNGALWFLGTDCSTSVIRVNEGEKKYIKYILFTDNGFSYEVPTLYQFDDHAYFGKPEVGYDGNVWFYKSFNNGADNKIYRVTSDKQVSEFDVEAGYIINDMKIGANGNIYIDGATYTAGKYNNFVKQYKNVNGKLELVKKYDNLAGEIDVDVNGNLWFNKDTIGEIYKLEGDTFVKKYIVNPWMGGLKVYDDNHMVVGGEGGYGLTIISIDDKNTTTNPVGDKNTTTQPSTPETKEKFAVKIDNNTKSATVSLDSAQISKNGINEITPTISNDVQAVETRVDASAVNGGTGSLKMNASNVTMELPFSAVDYEGTTEGSYISVKQNIIANDPLLSAIKDIGKVFDFSLATYKQDGTKIKDIHNFKSGKAKISIKLTNEDIKNLDTTKLSAFYYNEETKMWESVGGSFDKNAMTFTFETSHFSKYTIAQINGALPQTGTVLNNLDLIVLGFMFIVFGALFLGKKFSFKHMSK